MQSILSKINVLVVDDMATAREYISKQLRDIGVVNISVAVSYTHLDVYKRQLQWKMEYTNVVRNILPLKFSLRELQEVYEVVLNKAFDKRNFRKKILSLDMLVETNEYDTENSKRPAKLYTLSLIHI